MICFYYFCQKNLFFILGVAHPDLYGVQVGPEKAIVRGFAIIFQNYGIATEAINMNWIP